EGHDGIVLDYRDVGGPVQLVAFDPEQVVRPAAAAFRRGHDGAPGLSQARAEQAASRLLRAWRGRPPVHVVAREADLPLAIREAIDRQAAWGTVNAVYHQGAVYIVADRMQTAADVQRAVLHEVIGHY